MTESELRAWITGRARAGTPPLVLDGLRSSDTERRVLRVELSVEPTEAREAQLSELMMDMRLLGLNPAVCPELR
jgi:hypothetical protein